MKKFEYKIIVLKNHACYDPESRLRPSKKKLELVENNNKLLTKR